MVWWALTRISFGIFRAKEFLNVNDFKEEGSMKAITENIQMVAKCGLYCGACPKYLKSKCKGCDENTSATWCKIRKCCFEKDIQSCADCDQFSNVMDCKKYDNFMTRIFGFIFNSNRAACILLIKSKGYDAFVKDMVQKGKMTVKRK